MVRSKKVLCTCEDVTEEDVIGAIHEGYLDIESLKRYTGVSTGVCQGKFCLVSLIEILARETGNKPEEVGLTTQRPPIIPMFFGILAGETDEA